MTSGNPLFVSYLILIKRLFMWLKFVFEVLLISMLISMLSKLHFLLSASFLDLFRVPFVLRL